MVFIASLLHEPELSHAAASTAGSAVGETPITTAASSTTHRSILTVINNTERFIANITRSQAGSYTGVALLVCVGLNPGESLGEHAAAALGQQLASESTVEPGSPIMAFLQGMVPSNIFAALSRAQFISIVFFCILLGLALGVVKSPGADDTLRVLSALYEAFATIFHWVLIPLPFGLFALGAAHVAEANRELLEALVRYVGYFYLAGLVAAAGLTTVLSIVCRKTPWRILSDLKEPLVVAFATDNPLVALYSAIEALEERFGVDRRIADTVAPFGVLANQHGQVLLLTFTVLFLAQVFGISLGAAAIVIIAASCLISGAAAVGGGPALAPILAPILLNAQIPDALAVVVLATTQPAVAPLVSLLTVLGTAALTVITAKPTAGAVQPVAHEQAPERT